ncbi:MAG TPA: hypothetical protein VMF90_11420 [Rhizobiaceae bacterium]|nr:hypothetical protein [Rhizobiaceae bacterium]
MVTSFKMLIAVSFAFLAAGCSEDPTTTNSSGRQPTAIDTAPTVDTDPTPDTGTGGDSQANNPDGTVNGAPDAPD